MNEIVNSLLAAFGGVALVTGLSSRLGKVWANRILEKDRLRYQTRMETLWLNLELSARKRFSYIDSNSKRNLRSIPRCGKSSWSWRGL